MATLPVTYRINEYGVMVAQWLSLTEADQGAPIGGSDFPDKTVQVAGDFATAGAMTIEGSMDGVTYGTMNDHLGNALVITDSVPRTIGENPLFIRPRATAGSGNVELTITITGVK